MGDFVNFPIALHSDLGRELIVDCVRFAEGLLDEKAVRKKYRFDEDTWARLGDDDELVRAIEDEKTRRVRSGAAKREKAQLHIVKAPDVLANILMDSSASPKHRIDSAKTLDTFAGGGSESAPAADRFVITINLGSDVLRFDKSIAPDPNDIDPNDISNTPNVIAAFSAMKKDDDQW